MTQRKLQIKMKLLSALVPNARNARVHSDDQVAQIVASIREFGWTNPVLIDSDNGIIAGHGRVLAAAELGLDKISCIELPHLSDAQKKAYMIADNKLAENASWADNILNLELGELKKLDFDLEVIGFSIKEIDNLSGAGQTKKQDKNQNWEEIFSVIIECDSEEEQVKLLERLSSEGLKCRALTS